MSQRLRIFLAGILLLPNAAGAQTQLPTPEEAVSIQPVTSAQYKEHLDRLKALVETCEKLPAECDAKKVGDDDRVEGGAFQTRWSWLRNLVASAHNPAQADREKLLQEAAARLQEDATLAAESNPSVSPSFQRARKQADDVLARPEFQIVQEESYFARAVARFEQWLSEVFGGVSRFGKRSPWLVPLVEWGAMTFAAAGLLTWVFRTMQHQRLAVRIESTASAGIWQKESDNWAELACAEAEKKNWRAAVHCLYWATIVMLEGRKLWRQNRARTPREYLLLLEPGSSVQQGLRRMTQIFERIWYGLRPAAESDYARALELFDQLRSA
jgi:hypothetical protein